jgi:hypothetical protein
MAVRDHTLLRPVTKDQRCDFIEGNDTILSFGVFAFHKHSLMIVKEIPGLGVRLSGRALAY